MFDKDDWYISYDASEKGVKNALKQPLSWNFDKGIVIESAIKAIEQKMKAEDDISTDLVPTCSVSIEPNGVKETIEYETKREAIKTRRGKEKTVERKVPKKINTLEPKFSGRFSVNKAGKTIARGEFNGSVSYDKKEDASDLWIDAGLRENAYGKMFRECHKYDFGEVYHPNLRVDKDGALYHLWHSDEAYASDILCKAKEQGKGHYPECVFWKDKKGVRGSRSKSRETKKYESRGHMIIFEDIDRYFSCEEREYDHKRDWGFNYVTVCRPKSRLSRGNKKR